MNSFYRRGQANFEYLVLTGVLLAVLIPLTYTSLSTAYETYKMSRIDDVISQIVYKANDLYKLGPGNKDELRLSIPSGITGATVAGNEIALEATLGKENLTVRKFTESNVIGSLDTIQGEYVVTIKAINQSLVRIGSGVIFFSMEPSCIGAPNFANPPTINIFGDDFTQNTILLKDGAPFDPAYYTIIDAGNIRFTTNPTQFNVQPGGSTFLFTATDSGKTSNTLAFQVFPSPNQCP